MSLPFYLSVPPSQCEAHWDAVRNRKIGVITTPQVGNTHVDLWPIWAADNGCFTLGHRFNLGRYLDFLWEFAEYNQKCLFATAPDVVGDAVATWERSRNVLPRIKKLGYRTALVAQDGIEYYEPDWSTFDVLFIGGTTEWKLSPIVLGLVRYAKERGKWVHVGRVNSLKRLKHFNEADSADGTYLKYGPEKNIRRLLEWYK